MIVFRRFLDDYFSNSDGSSTSISLSLIGLGCEVTDVDSVVICVSAVTVSAVILEASVTA